VVEGNHLESDAKHRQRGRSNFSIVLYLPQQMSSCMRADVLLREQSDDGMFSAVDAQA
jgi:hypothetical protein